MGTNEREWEFECIDAKEKDTLQREDMCKFFNDWRAKFDGVTFNASMWSSRYETHSGSDTTPHKGSSTVKIYYDVSKAEWRLGIIYDLGFKNAKYVLSPDDTKLMEFKSKGLGWLCLYPSDGDLALRVNPEDEIIVLNWINAHPGLCGKAKDDKDFVATQEK